VAFSIWHLLILLLPIAIVVAIVILNRRAR
jgi:hypothetical protein